MRLKKVRIRSNSHYSIRINIEQSSLYNITMKVDDDAIVIITSMDGCIQNGTRETLTDVRTLPGTRNP